MIRIDPDNQSPLIEGFFYCKGGGGGGKPKSKPKKSKSKPKRQVYHPPPMPVAPPIIMQAPRMPDFPEMPAPPPPPPPPTEYRDEVQQAKRDKKRQVSRRRGFLASKFAGETGGYGGSLGGGATGKKTLGGQ